MSKSNSNSNSQEDDNRSVAGYSVFSGRSNSSFLRNLSTTSSNPPSDDELHPRTPLNLDSRNSSSLEGEEFHREMTELKKKIYSNKEIIKDLEKELKRLGQNTDNEMTGIKEQITSLIRKSSEKDEHLLQFQQRVKRLSDAKDRCEQDREADQSKIRQLEQDLSSHKDTVTNLTNEMAKLKVAKVRDVGIKRELDEDEEGLNPGTSRASKGNGNKKQKGPATDAQIPPKKPKNAYIFWLGFHGKGLSAKDAGTMWKELPLEEKAPYTEMFKKDQERYQREIALYNQQLQQN